MTPEWAEAAGTWAAAVVAVIALVVSITNSVRDKQRVAAVEKQQLVLEKQQAALEREQVFVAQQRRRDQARFIRVTPVRITKLPGPGLRATYGVSVHNQSTEDISEVIVGVDLGPDTANPRDQMATAFLDRLAPDVTRTFVVAAELNGGPGGHSPEHRGAARVAFRDVNGVAWERSEVSGLRELDDSQWAQIKARDLDENQKRGVLQSAPEEAPGPSFDVSS